MQAIKRPALSCLPAVRFVILRFPGATTGLIRDASGREVPDREVLLPKSRKGINGSRHTNRGGAFLAPSRLDAAGDRPQ